MVHIELRNATFKGEKIATSIKRPDSGEYADENWPENERIHIQGRRKYLNMLLQWSRDFISEGEMEDPRRKRVTLLELLAAILLNWRK